MSNFVVYVKAHIIKDGEKEGKRGQLGACPYSHRVLLALEEKEIPYQIDFVNLEKKPEWLTKVNPQGSVPILKDIETDAYIVDSDTISDYLEQKYAKESEFPKKPLGNIAECPQPGANIWAAFQEFLVTSKGKEALQAELQKINDAVGDSQPYTGGKEPNAWDVALAPRLYLAKIGCADLRDWDFTQEYPNVKTYLHRWTGRSSWRNTASWDEESIVDDLKAFVAKRQEK